MSGESGSGSGVRLWGRCSGLGLWVVLATFLADQAHKWWMLQVYKIAERGYLKPGHYADIVVFDPVNFAPRADYVNPRVPSVGVEALFVNGRLALDKGKATGIAAGRALLRSRPAHCPAS